MALRYAEELRMGVVPYHSTDEGGSCTCGNPSCENPGKHPDGSLAPNGSNSASRDRSRITAWFNSKPEMNYGVVSDTVAVLDLDSESATEAARQRGLPRTFTVKSGRGWHLYYRVPKGSRGWNPPGMEIKCGGVPVVGAESKHHSGRAYEVVRDLPLADAPDWMVRTEVKRPPRGERNPRPPVEGGLKIPKHSRNSTLTSMAGSLHDGTRDLARLTEDLLRIRDERCEEPETVPDSEVEKLARWTHRQETCSPRKTDPEVEEVLEAASRHWYEERLPRGGRSKLRDTYRACLASAAKRREVGTATVGGVERRGAMFSDSTRQLAEAANTSNVAVWKNLNKLAELGALVAVEQPEGLATTWLLTKPVQKVNTPHNFSLEEEVVGGVNPLRAYELETPMYGWRSPVGNAGGGVEAALEAFGPQTSEELSRRLDISRPGDLERRQLLRLEEMGVLERDGDGLWRVPADHAAAVDSRMKERYTTIHRRRRHKHTNEGRRVSWVEETITDASEEERARDRSARHAKDREGFRRRRQAWLDRIAAECFGGVDPETGEIVSERKQAPVEESETIRSEAEVFEIMRGFFADVGSAA